MANQNAIIEESNLEENLKTQFGKTIDAKDNENGTFTIYMEESNKEYIVSNNGEMLNEGINWEKAKKETQKHPDQQEERNQNVIGIGTDGKAVNMDLWEYTQLDDGTFALNDEESVKYVDGVGSNVTKGYLGNFENGRIIGSIPQYISLDNGKSYKEVTNLWGTFFKCQELVYAPISPNTVTNMNLTFSQNTNLQDASYISYKSVDMWATYSRMFKTKGDTSFA